MGAPSEPERTDDGRWLVIGGRRWRASDPAIPAPFRRELVEELMSARRAVGAAKRAEDPASEAGARRRVHQAKVALGERGDPWWEPASPSGRRQRLAAAVVTLTGHRGPDRTICPSDAARAVGGEGWRALMETAREVVRGLALAGEVEINQKGQVIDPVGKWRGPIRVRSVAARGSTVDGEAAT